MHSFSVPKLASADRCTGCEACANGCPKGAIRMVPNAEGFLYPEVTELCVQCGHCSHICPALKQREQRPEPTVFAAWNPDAQVRQSSTAGGVFSAIASYVLDAGGIVFGAAMNPALHVSHIAIREKADLPLLQGAKLVQSEIGLSYRQVQHHLDAGRYVFFTGTPCQVDGLYRYLGESPERLLTADILCRGVPSPGVWEKIVNSMTYIRQSRLTSVQFCRKADAAEYRFTASFDGGKAYDAPFAKSDYGRGMLRNLFLRPACYQCPYHSPNRPADFTLGLYRGLPADFHPEIPKNDISLFMVNTVKGAHVFDRLPLRRERRPLGEAVGANSSLLHPAVMPPERAAFFEAFIHSPFRHVYQRFFSISDLSYRIANGSKLQKLFHRSKHDS